MNEPPAPVLFCENLSYAYKNHRALTDVGFSVMPRSIHGFVGPNGAGKTTALKIFATLLKPQTGNIRVFGYDLTRDYKQIRRRLGFMPDHFSMYRQMTIFEYLDFFAAAYGMNLAQRDKVIADVLTLTDMAGRKDDLIKSLSRGMQQRVSLARVLVHDPELLLLDEPASGLDPRARIELMEILTELRRMGKTIFISSHILAELGTLCDSVTILDRGRLKYSGPIRGLLARDGAAANYVLTLAAESPAIEKALLTVDGVSAVAKLDGTPAYRVAFNPEKANTNIVLRAAIESGASVVGFQEDLKQLNQAFMDLTEPGVGA